MQFKNPENRLRRLDRFWQNMAKRSKGMRMPAGGARARRASAVEKCLSAASGIMEKGHMRYGGWKGHMRSSVLRQLISDLRSLQALYNVPRMSLSNQAGTQHPHIPTPFFGWSAMKLSFVSLVTIACLHSVLALPVDQPPRRQFHGP